MGASWFWYVPPPVFALLVVWDQGVGFIFFLVYVSAKTHANVLVYAPTQTDANTLVYTSVQTHADVFALLVYTGSGLSFAGVYGIRVEG